MVKKTAHLIQDNLKKFHGHAALYKLSVPVAYVYLNDLAEVLKNQTSYVICSSINREYMGVPDYPVFAVQETYIFPADENGTCLGFTEISGSQKDTLSHEKVLKNIGYTLSQEPFKINKMIMNFNFTDLPF